MGQRKVSFKIKHSFFYCFKVLVSLNNSTHARAHCEFEKYVRSFAQEKKSQQAPEIDALVRDRKVFAWCHKIN